jgi:polysaccharide pyruvyl transferase WcaK-like protein
VFEKVPEFVAHIAAALDTVVERQGATILFLSNEIRADACFDQAAAKYVASRMRYADHTRVAPGEYHAPRDMMSIVACCSATMSMRYHFCLFSALQSVPFFAIERSAKVTDLCRDLGWTDSAEPAKLDRNNITGALQRFQQDQTAIRANLRYKSQKMRGRAMNNIVAVNALRERVPR